MASMASCSDSLRPCLYFRLLMQSPHNFHREPKDHHSYCSYSKRDCRLVAIGQLGAHIMHLATDVALDEVRVHECPLVLAVHDSVRASSSLRSASISSRIFLASALSVVDLVSFASNSAPFASSTASHRICPICTLL